MKPQRLLVELWRRRARRRRRVPIYDWGDGIPLVVWERETRAFFSWISGPAGRS